MKCILKTKQNKTFKFRKLVSWVSPFPAIVPLFGIPNCFLKIIFFFCKRVQEGTYKVSVHVASSILEKWTGLSISLTLPLSHFHKAKVQIQPKWAFVALGPRALLQPKGTVLEIPMCVLFWRLAVSFAGKLSCWKICCLALHLSLLSPVPYAAGLY